MARTKDETLHAERRAAILQAAAFVFKAKGFHLARTEDICVAAGLSAGTVFRYFVDKQAMIMGIAEIEIGHFKREIRRLISKERLHWLARITGPELTELLRPTIYNLGADSWLELARDVKSKKRILTLDKKLRRTLAQELALGQTEGWVRKSLEPKGAANVIMAVFSGLSFDREIGAVIDPDATARALGELFHNMIVVQESQRGSRSV